ncbi:MAG: hypothetical protein IJN43_11825 [Ruminococcus sp.]|nr:hypothetical protein [Ruminococcus sp.]
MLIYKNKKYATTTNFQFECDRALDCQITFKRPDSKIKFLEFYSQREDLNRGDSAAIENRKFQMCYFYDITDDPLKIKCHVSKEADCYRLR